MLQTAEECIEFLAQARQTLDEKSVLQDRKSHLESDEKLAERALEAEKKSVADNIRLTIKKRSDDLTSQYDKEIGKGQERLKKARSRREKAKNQGIKERIAEETLELHTENRELKTKLHTLFQEHGVPGYCRTDLYYALFFPSRVGEMFKLIIALLICFAGIPFTVYQLIPNHRPLYLIGIYLIDILVLGGGYVLIGNKNRTEHSEALKTGRQIKNAMFSNNKKIKVIVHSIKRDKNDSQYDLEIYDDDISKIEQELADMTGKKRDALNTFETVTKNIISDEIENSSKAKLEEMQKHHEDLQTQLSAAIQELKEKNLFITDNYSAYLGTEFLDSMKISELTDILKSGKATSISEAMEQYKNSNA